MKINIISMGRFHVADLAICLSEHGHEVTFISDVPASILRKYGLSENIRVITLWPNTFWTLLSRLLPRFGIGEPEWATKFRMFALDMTAGIAQPRCDLIIGMSGIVIWAGTRAQKKFGAQFWLERGSRHILSQKQILDSRAPDVKSAIPDWTVDRELRGYRIADRVVIPSDHCPSSEYRTV